MPINDFLSKVGILDWMKPDLVFLREKMLWLIKKKSTAPLVESLILGALKIISGLFVPPDANSLIWVNGLVVLEKFQAILFHAIFYQLIRMLTQNHLSAGETWYSIVLSVTLFGWFLFDLSLVWCTKLLYLLFSENTLCQIKPAIIKRIILFAWPMMPDLFSVQS